MAGEWGEEEMRCWGDEIKTKIRIRFRTCAEKRREGEDFERKIGGRES